MAATLKINKDKATPIDVEQAKDLLKRRGFDIVGIRHSDTARTEIITSEYTRTYTANNGKEITDVAILTEKYKKAAKPIKLTGVMYNPEDKD